MSSTNPVAKSGLAKGHFSDLSRALYDRNKGGKFLCCLFNHHKTHMKHYVPLSKATIERAKKKAFEKKTKNSLFDIRKLLLNEKKRKKERKEPRDKKNVHWKESEKTTRRIYKFKIFIRHFSLMLMLVRARTPARVRVKKALQQSQAKEEKRLDRSIGDRLVKRERKVCMGNDFGAPLVLDAISRIKVTRAFSLIFTFYSWCCTTDNR